MNGTPAVDYRLSGEACHPAQLLDALAGYRYLVQGCKVSPERIVIMADCAGSRWSTYYVTDNDLDGVLNFSPPYADAIALPEGRVDVEGARRNHAFFGRCEF
jgi:dienelactone hydrolase